MDLEKACFIGSQHGRRIQNFGSPCANNLMVDSKGQALESLNVFGDI
jgi:hypothetical protein